MNPARGAADDGGWQDMESRDPARPRSAVALVLLSLCAIVFFSGFAALGTWQLHRLRWKLDLIERVGQRVHAPPVAAPGPERWAAVTAATDEYRHVRLAGTFLHDLTTRVQAVTELGSGFWLLTPLRMADGSVVLVNRGFVPAGTVDRPQASRAAEEGVVVTGLLRMTEPGRGFLRHNDSAGNRWYSRDVQAIARARGLSAVAPYFVDADATGPSASTLPGTSAPGTSDRPVGGLTVIAFHNNHLIYALTWYALALMVAGAGLWVGREEWRLRRAGAGGEADAGDRGKLDDGKNCE